MALQQVAVKEQLVKTVVKSGNGGAVWVPKAWLGEEVVIILPEKPKLSLKEQILRMLEPYLKDILSVSIYGSYARNEATQESDIDVLVITKEKPFTVLVPHSKIEILVLPLHKMREAIEKYPALYYQIVREAEPLINSSVLEELRTISVQKKRILEYLKETKEQMKMNKEFIQLDAVGGVYLTSFSVLYSLFLRFRAIFIIKSILTRNSFSNKKFKRWMLHKGMTNKDFEAWHDAYRSIRDNRNIPKIKIKIATVEKIISLLEHEVRMREEEL